MTETLKAKIYGLVRDKNGKPKFDNIRDIPAQLWNQLTHEERKDIQARGGYQKGAK